jgi:rhamnosyltransferase
MASAAPRVDILLSTYNGSKYLAEQIASLQAQSASDWRLLVRDDGSNDGTVEILHQLAALDPRIHIVADDEPAASNLGASRSFCELLKQVEAPYFMFCDQDDVWHPSKVEKTLKQLELLDGAPALVFSDLRIVDSKLQQLSPSFMQYQRFDPQAGMNFRRLVMQNHVVGCTLGANRALLELSGLRYQPIPAAAMMHDWWLALVAAALGKMAYIDTPTIDYRQHANNALGAPGSNWRRYVRQLLNNRPWEKAQHYLARVSLQAQAFLDRYEGRLKAADRAVLEKVASLQRRNLPLTLLRCFYSGACMHALDRNVALFMSNVFGRYQPHQG